MASKKDHIAIIGAGFSGLACAYYLSNSGYPVTVYDPSSVGENASGISAGLLHCYTGTRARPPVDATKKVESTLELLQISQEALGSSVFKQSGLFRPAINERQEADFRKRAEEFDDVRWMTTEESKELYPDLLALPGIWIQKCYAIDTGHYLEGLWLACSKRGARWEKRQVGSLDELEGRQIILATGAATALLGREQKIHPIKGHVLEIEWDIELPSPISANIYFVPSKTPNRCLAGGTFEHTFDSVSADVQTAKELLFPKIHTLFPQLGPCRIINCKAALRGSTPNRQPICGKMDENTWILAGMGSKGLLNHAYFANNLVNQIIK